MTKATDAWLTDLFRPVLHAYVCGICGAIVPHDYRTLHAAFHGRKPADA